MAKGVQYDFSGQYYTGNKHQEEIKDYEISIVFPAETPKALSFFKTGLSQPTNTICKLMIQKYPDFKRVRTYTVDMVTNLDGGKTQASNNVATMSLDELKACITDKNLSIDVEVYSNDLTKIRSAVIQAIDDPEGFKETYKADVEAYAFNKSLNDLNPATPETQGTQENADNANSQPTENTNNEVGADGSAPDNNTDGNTDGNNGAPTETQNGTPNVEDVLGDLN